MCFILWFRLLVKLKQKLRILGAGMKFIRICIGYY
jgi:hypothetical protein